MKLYIVYKKQFNILILFILVFLPFLFVYAETAEELQNKINKNNNDISVLEQEINSYQSQLNELSKQKSSLNGSIQAFNLTRKKLIGSIGVTEKKIEKTNFEIQGLGKDINTKEYSISNNTKAISVGIKQTNEFENESIIAKFLSSDDLSLIWNDIDNMVTIREKIRNKTTELKQVKVELEGTRKETINAKNKLLRLKSELADQKKIVEQNANEKKRLLAQTKNSEANYQRILKSRLAQKDALEKELRDYESQLKYNLDPSRLPSKGVFSWPLDYVYITQLFGRTVDSKRLYASGSHGGVDFRAAVGTPVRAMASGVIAGVGDTDRQCYKASFGKYVFIEYDNGLSGAYGHLSLVKVKKGSKVSRGQVVAYTGNTGYSTGPHLHISVYAPGAAEIKSIPSKSCPRRVLTQPIASVHAYLDPMYFLPPYKK